MNVKQVIVIRKDLKMRRGKEIAQSCHASLKVFFDRMIQSSEVHFSGVKYFSKMELTPEMKYWKENCFTKICLYVNSEEELLSVVEKAKDANIPVALITDSGKTEFNGVPTNTCCAIGPDLSERINEITGNLPLY